MQRFFPNHSSTDSRISGVGKTYFYLLLDTGSGHSILKTLPPRCKHFFLYFNWVSEDYIFKRLSHFGQELINDMVCFCIRRVGNSLLWFCREKHVKTSTSGQNKETPNKRSIFITCLSPIGNVCTIMHFLNTYKAWYAKTKVNQTFLEEECNCTSR